MKQGSVERAPHYDQRNQGLSEYLLQVYPGQEIHEKVMTEKQHFDQRYGHPMAVGTRPHITLARFMGREEMEETLIRWMQRICCMVESFLITFNNYSGFPPHTIYLRIQDPLPVFTLIKQLKVINEFLLSSSCPPLESSIKPHLTIARLLPEKMYNRAIIEYAQKDFHETFRVSEMILLKQDQDLDLCKRINVFQFLPAGNVN